MNAELLLEHFHRLGDAPDAVPRLRRFILELAVRGKLVEQDERDEPASVLLARIDGQVAKAVKSGALRKQVEKAEVQDAPYELPNGWEWVRFGRLAEFSAGRTPSRNDHSFWNTGDYPWVSIADLIDDGEVVETKETVSRKAKALFGSEPSAKGTIIMSFKLTIGKISRLGVDAYHNEAIISIYPHEPELDGYLFKVLPECSRAGKTKDAIKGATLNRESIHNILIPLPPLPEQHRIVAKVEELMALCDGLERALEADEAVKTKALEAVVRSEIGGKAPPAPVRVRQLPVPKVRAPRYEEAEVELAVAAEPVGHTGALHAVVRRGPGRPPKSGALTSTAAPTIETWLQAHPGWHGKAAILKATGVDASAWNAAIKELLEAGNVERQGEKKGARYRGS